jgi:hypothetical protein
MERTEVLRSIDLEQLDYIQQKIEVIGAMICNYLLASPLLGECSR